MLESLRVIFPLPPLAGGEGRVRGVDASGSVLPRAHLTLPPLWGGPLPLPRKAAERGFSAGD